MNAAQRALEQLLTRSVGAAGTTRNRDQLTTIEPKYNNMIHHIYDVRTIDISLWSVGYRTTTTSVVTAGNLI